MHLLLRERSFLDEEAPAEDLGLAPSPILFGSFSDADLALITSDGVACAPLSRLTHPMSVDLLVENTLPGTGLVLLRLLGGAEAWRYGVDELEAACVRLGIPFVLLGGCSRVDPTLPARSTIDDASWRRLDTLARQGGRAGWTALRTLARNLVAPPGSPAHAPHAPDTPDAPDPDTFPPFGEIALPHPEPAPIAQPLGRAAIIAYRSHAVSDDLAPHLALAAALAERRIETRLFHVASPKDPDCAAFLKASLAEFAPGVVLNATCFSSRRPDGSNALDAGVPVLQLVLAGTDETTFRTTGRGLAPADLAMQVMLPELDGRLATTAIGAKAATGASRRAEPLADGLALASDRAQSWLRLAATPRAERRVAIVLSDYPGADGTHATGHAVGLDGFASLASILGLLAEAGYDTAGPPPGDLVAPLCRHAPAPILDLPAYRRLFATLPDAIRAGVLAAHGEPEHDPAFASGGLALRHLRLGRILLAVQPPRGTGPQDRAGHHDRSAAPSHAYLGAYLWLRAVEAIDAVIHLGTHGTLEWLPGKPDIATAACTQAALLRGLPVLYPVIVNNPGEAAAAKRRLGAVTIGHLTPPLHPAGLSGEAAGIEQLLEELASADGVDRRRADRLRAEIVGRAAASGLLAEAEGPPARTPSTDPSTDPVTDEDRIARLDAYLCDVKELRIADGLHVFGEPPAARDAMLAMVGPAQAAPLDACPAAERLALLDGLDGRFVEPGPAGAPLASRTDVLPTGRNLVGNDVRLLPTATAMTLAARRAETLLARHAQDHGEPPRSLVLDLWGSPTLRTGGEDLALAFVLVGAAPLRHPETGRIEGVEILPLALLDRPRVDVALRISGLFRDLFAPQIALFDRACRMIAERDEAASDNPLAASRRKASNDPASQREAPNDPASQREAPNDPPSRREASGADHQPPCRVFGPAPETYGASPSAWLERSGFGYGIGRAGEAAHAGLSAILSRADAFLHQQDNPFTDVLDGPEHAAHEGGFALAARAHGASPALYHADIAAGGRIRTLRDEIARVTRGRLANPDWLAGMRRHAYRGASEMARGTEALLAFARTLDTRLDAQFDLAADALLHDPTNRAFLEAQGPEALRTIERSLARAREEGLWHPRRNDAA